MHTSIEAHERKITPLLDLKIRGSLQQKVFPKEESVTAFLPYVVLKKSLVV